METKNDTSNNEENISEVTDMLGEKATVSSTTVPDRMNSGERLYVNANYSQQSQSTSSEITSPLSAYGPPVRRNGQLPAPIRNRYDRRHSCSPANKACNMRYLYGDDINNYVAKCFEKTFTLKTEKHCVLPQQKEVCKCLKWKVHFLQNNKARLNIVKDKLNDFNLKEWHEHTRYMNPAAAIMPYLKKTIQVEFLTQAWCKFYEIASTYPIIPDKATEEGKLLSVHLCEAPGAFVTSLNHFLKSNYKHIEWSWIANTLNPFYEGHSLSAMINDDRLILNTLDNWYFGAHGTGDIFELDYAADLLNEIVKKNLNKDYILLVTADGSFDCQDDPGQQETRVASLHVAEVLVALKILVQGGTFILKIFTMFECDTLCLLYLLFCAFESVNIFKPCTSKEGNSESYVVCIGYKGLNAVQDQIVPIENYMKHKHWVTRPLYSILSVPLEFIMQVVNCSNLFTDTQIAVIERNIRLFKDPEVYPCRRTVAALQIRVRDMFINKYKISSIDGRERVVPVVEIQNDFTVIEPRTAIIGSYSDQKKKAGKNLGAEDIAKELDSIKEILESLKPTDIPVTLTSERLVDSDIATFKPSLGTNVHVIRSSQFCYSGFMRLKTNLLKMWVPDEKPTKYKGNVEPSFDPPNSVICDVNDVFYMDMNATKLQRVGFARIMAAYNSVPEGGTLVLIGFPLLTHFNVSVIYTLRYCFESVTYEHPYRIVLKNYKRNDTVTDCLEIVRSYLQLMKKTDCDLLSFIPVHLLRENRFYKWVVNLNNCDSERTLRDIIQKLQPQKSDG